MRISDWSSDVCSSDLAVDHDAPAQPAQPDLEASSDSGISNTDNITNGTTPTFTGTAEGSVMVHFFDTNGPQILGMTVSELSGRWTFMVTTPLTEGTYNFMVVATDLAGNASVASTPREITIDLTARSEEHTSELQSLMRTSYAVFCLTKK